MILYGVDPLPVLCHDPVWCGAIGAIVRSDRCGAVMSHLGQGQWSGGCGLICSLPTILK